MPFYPVKKSIAVYFIALCLLFSAAIQIVCSMRTKSPTCDELAHHVASGYSYLVTGNFKMNPASPPLPRMLAAAPLLLLHAKAPLDHPSWKEGNSPVFANQFFYHYNTRADDFIFWARVPIVGLSLIFGFFVFFWAKNLFGDIAGLASLWLYSFCPDILAHSGLATADLAVALFFFLSLMSFYYYLEKPSKRFLILTGVLAGLTFLSKFTAILLFPTLLLIAIVGGKIKSLSPLKVILCVFICFFTVWAGYFFELKPLLKNTPDPAKKIAVYKKIGGESLVRFAQEAPVPLSTFSSALVSMMYTRASGTHAYLMGHWSRTGWWYYYFVAFCIKNTIPFLILIVLSFLLFRKLNLSRLAAAVLFVPILFFLAATMRDKAQAGIRYFLPIYPLFFILSGLTTAYLWNKGKVFRLAAMALLIWHSAEAVFIYPDYLSYFNQLIGGPKNGYKYLRDSNIDWGQDFKGLGKWVNEKGYSEVVILTISPVDPSYYKIPYRSFKKEEFVSPKNTVYAVGAHLIDNVIWAKDRKPDKLIGYSFFVYDFRTKR